jgi:glycosyltransferase involved in cell wall biosynthesis
MPKVLFVHNGAPGRFAPLASALMARGWNGAVINGPGGADIPGLDNRRFAPEPAVPASAFRPARPVEAALLMGRGAAQAAQRLKADGFVPDLVIGHPGWGEMLFVDEVFRGVPQIQLGEYWYHSEGADANFDPEFPARLLDSRIMIGVQNAPFALSYAHAAAIVAPTRFQAGLIPACFQSKVHVVHEGVDTARIRRSAPEVLRLADGTELDGAAPIISFACRRFEPLRGVHVFMRMLPRLLELAPSAHVLMIGGDDRATYGIPPRAGGTWLAAMKREMGDAIDWGRVHVLPPLAPERLHRVFSNVAAHVYLTYPFALSTSLIEAMACGALVVGSDTGPVHDAIEHGQTGLLVDFFDGEGMARQLAEICAAPERHAAIRLAARASVVERFDRATVCEPAWLELIGAVCGRQLESAVTVN